MKFFLRKSWQYEIKIWEFPVTQIREIKKKERHVHPKWTNPPVKRLSFNRSQRKCCSTKYDTPTETQVVYKWFGTSTLHGVCIVSAHWRNAQHQRRAVLLWLCHHRRRKRSTCVYRCLPTPRRIRYRYIFGRDSDLEAFSHNPSDGSLAPLAYQPST